MATPLVFVLNCGSSSLKFSVVDVAHRQSRLSGFAEYLHLPEAQIQWKTDTTRTKKAPLGHSGAHDKAIQFIVRYILPSHSALFEAVTAIGHRIVHGGEQLTHPQYITPKVIQLIKECQNFAPLHNPSAVVGIQATLHAFPHLAQRNIAVFDTAFHRTLPEEAYLYALPYTLYQNHGVRRYGFHGISHQFVSQQAAQLLGKPLSTLNLITCHLGNGASVAAIRGGQSIDTSMGMTPLEGMVMGTRCGDIDPAIIFYLYHALGLSMEKINDLLTKHSGLLGLSEVTSDCRYIESHALEQANAQRALKVFCYRLIKYIGAYTAALGDRIDALIFTGGIGENSVLMREQVLKRLSILGFAVDSARNQAACRGQGGFIHAATSHPILVIPTHEEQMIAETCLSLLASSPISEK